MAAVTIFMSDSDSAAATSGIHTDPGLGIGTVVGSTMFNTLCIIGGSAIVSSGRTRLDWRTLARDAGGYFVAICVLTGCIALEICSGPKCDEETNICSSRECTCPEKSDDGNDVCMEGWGTIRPYETVIMISCYTGYVILVRLPLSLSHCALQHACFGTCSCSELAGFQ